MAHFRKKPVVIEAWQFNPDDRAYSSDMPEWLEAAFDDERVSNVGGRRDYRLHIRTLEDGPNGEAKHIADRGDWIIQGIKGELYPCKPDIFAATYEPVEGDR